MASKFRTSFTHVEGHDPARVVQGRIININLVTWTVDVNGQFDRKKYFDIQVGGLYLHHSNGEGVYVFPEVGATCTVTIPSDSSPPYVSSFIMASETVDDSAPDALAGTTSHAQQPANTTNATYAGGRLQPKPGDIVMRTRDGNFVILHRGGVLQIGATELSQRIFIPLNNLVEDISENYEHHNSAGSIVWGIQEGPSQKQIPGQYMQTFRVFSTDQYADVKLACGKVFAPIPEPDGGQNLAEAGVGQGDDGKGKNPIIFEVTVSPKGFVAESGETASQATIANSVFKFTFDRKGNTLLRTEGNMLLQVDKKLTFKVAGDFEGHFGGNAQMTAGKGFDIDGGPYSHIKGKTVRLEAGLTPVARLGDQVILPLLVPAPVILTFSNPPTPGTPCAATIQCPPALPLPGTIATGNNKVLA